MTVDPAAARRFRRRLVPMAACVALAGLPMFAATGNSVLPSDIRDVIRDNYVSPDHETRYLDAAVDLDGDGQLEYLVHVAGGTACSAEGCPTLVFTHLASGFRLLSTIDNSAPPIRVSTDASKGWLNLIVRVVDANAGGRDVELKFDGRSYPADPTVSNKTVKAARNRGRLVINSFAFEGMKPFPAASR